MALCGVLVSLRRRGTCVDLTTTSNCGSCGTPCSSGQACFNTACCTPTTCSQLGFDCGLASDGCGGTLPCGSCPTGQTCSNNHCVSG
jgi:hypothetical protein